MNKFFSSVMLALASLAALQSVQAAPTNNACVPCANGNCDGLGKRIHFPSVESEEGYFEQVRRFDSGGYVSADYSLEENGNHELDAENNRNSAYKLAVVFSNGNRLEYFLDGKRHCTIVPEGAQTDFDRMELYSRGS